MTTPTTAPATGTSADPLETALRGYAAAPVQPPVLVDGDVSYVVDDTVVGRMLLAARPDGTALAAYFTPTDPDVDRVLGRLAATVSPRVLRLGRGLDPLRRELDGFLAGKLHSFTVPVDLALAAPFQRDVLTHLRAVGYGKRTTYGALARTTGRPTASRAVGAALGSNPLCIVLPCHRVVAASGSLTGYAGGLEVKRRLLDLESGHLPLP